MPHFCINRHNIIFSHERKHTKLILKGYKYAMKMIDLFKIPNQYRRPQLLHAFCRLMMTSEQESSAMVSRRLRYLKDVTVYRGCPYALNAAAAPAYSYLSVSRHYFLSAPCTHSAVVGWHLFISDHGTSMSQEGQQGWGRLPPPKITIVSCT